MTDKTPVRVVFDSDNAATGLGEFQTGETVPLAHGGTGSALTIGNAGQVMRVNAAGTAIEFADQGDVDVIASSDSTGVQVQDDLNVSGTLSVNVLDVNEISSQDSTGITISDDVLLKGTLRAEDSTTISIDGGVTISGNLDFGSGSAVSTILDEDNMASNSNTALATQQSIKAYVDAEVAGAGGNLGISDSSSNTGSITLGTNDLEFRSGDSITATVAGTGVTFDLNESITVDQIDAGDSSLISIGSATKFNSTLAFNGDGTVSVSSIKDEDNMASNSNSALATQQSIKAYVDSVAGGTLSIGDSSSNTGSLNINAGDNLEFRSGDSITATVAGNGVTFDLNESISVDTIEAGDSSAITVNSATIFASSFKFNGDAKSISTVLDEDAMGTDSDTALATQQSIKAYVDAQDANIASDTLTLTNKTFDAEGTGNSLSNIDVANLKSGVLDTDISSVSESDDTLASAKAIKTYVDSVAGGSLALGDSASNAGSVNLPDDEQLVFIGNDSITATVSGNTVTFDLNETITVDQINAGDSSTITLGAAVEGSTINMDSISVDQINSRDSSAISFANSIIVDAISSGDSSFVRINDSIETENAQINTNLTVDGNAQVKGNLTVQGTTTYIETTNTKVSDPLLLLNNGNSGGADIDSGIMIERGSAGNNAVFYWNEGDDQFKAVLTTSAESATTIADSAYATVNLGGLVFSDESVVADSILDEDAMGSNSNTALATQQSIKAYVDAEVGAHDSLTFSDSASNSSSVLLETNDLEFRAGNSITPTVAGTGVTFALNDDITVNTISSADSTAVTIADNANIEGTLQVNSTINAVGNITTAGSFIIGSASINETDLEKIDGITNGAGAANKALVLDGSANVASGLAALTASGVITAAGFTIGSAVINETDLEQIDGLTAGTVAASKAVVVDANKDVSSFRNLTATDTITTATLDVNSIKSTDSTHIRIDEGLDVVGTLKVQEITSLDSSDVLITNLRVESITGNDSSVVNFQESVNVNGSMTASGSFIIGSADMNETDLEKLDGITNGTAVANKAVVLDGSKNIGTLGAVTATSIVLGSADINEADLEQIDGLTAGTVAASKAVVVDSNKDIGDFRNVTLSGTLHTTTLDVREIESTDSTVVTVNEGLEILGTLQVNEIVASDSSEVTINNLRTQVITANDSTEILVNDAMRVSGLITGTATQAQYADLAEIFPTDDTDLEPGDVVDFSGDNKVAKSNQEAHTSVAGVISTEPGFLLNEGGTGVKLAMTGKVPCKVQGIVNAGDLLVSAGNGKAKSATNPSVGTVIGKAIENHTSDGNGVINIMVVLM